MNTEHIFKLFNNSIQHKSDDEIEKEILESAHYNAKMFIKYVTNIKNFQLKLLMLAEKGTSKDLSADKAKAEAIGYAKAFSHVGRINIHNINHINDLDLINPFDLGYCLQICKTYYLSQEDFDKVAFLMELSDFAEKRYNNLELTE